MHQDSNASYRHQGDMPYSSLTRDFVCWITQKFIRNCSKKRKVRMVCGPSLTNAGMKPWKKAKYIYIYVCISTPNDKSLPPSTLPPLTQPLNHWPTQKSKYKNVLSIPNPFNSPPTQKQNLVDFFLMKIQFICQEITFEDFIHNMLAICSGLNAFGMEYKIDAKILTIMIRKNNSSVTKALH